MLLQNVIYNVSI